MIPHDPIPAAVAYAEPQTSAEWAGYVAEAWQDAVESIITSGRRIAEALDRLPHGTKAEFYEALPFSMQTARKLVQIAEHPVLSNLAHVRVLPAAWGTLAELAKLDPERLEDLIDRGVIRPDLTRSDAVDMVRATDLTARIAAGLDAIHAETRHHVATSSDDPSNWSDDDWTAIYDRHGWRAHPLLDAIDHGIYGEHWAGFVDSIRDAGVETPVVVNQHGVILDGRNRIAAADVIGVDFPVKVIRTAGPDEDIRVICDYNLLRQHLTEGQRAFIALGLAELEEGR